MFFSIHRKLVLAAAMLLAIGLETRAQSSAEGPAGGQAAPRTEGRLTPEIVKKYDKDGDGSLDEAERAAARADPSSSRQPEARPQQRPPLPRAAGGPKTSTGQVPLTEMIADDRVRGQDGGLYGNGRNEPPEELQIAARQRLAQIVPLDDAGRKSPDGKIVLLSIGIWENRS